MSASTRTPGSSWIEEELRALAAGGPDAVRIELLARALGVTRGGFYWHFDDRRALLEEILDTWERVSVDEVIERVESEGGDARAKLQRRAAEDRPRSPRLGPARADGRRAPPTRRQPAHGLPALAVRCLLPRRVRRRGPLHGLLLAVDRQPLHRRRSRRAQPRRRAEAGPEAARGLGLRRPSDLRVAR